jgi:hypothetical protein
MTSSINPQNIDGNYPVAGVPNNTQGFRDNFTNIQTNFTYAKNEITDLENKAILKSALSGTTLDNNMADQLIYSALIRDFSGSLVQNTVTAGSVILDYSAGHYQTVSTTGSITLGFSNFPAAGTVGMMRVQVNITNTAYTMTLPAAVTLGITGIQGISSNVITFAATGYYEFGFVTSDGGTTVTVFDLNRPLSYYTNTVNVAATTSSSSTTTGALIVAGGVGIAGNLYIGGNIFGNTSISNITLGNISASGFVSAAGNVTGGNIRTAGVISATGNIVVSTTGSIGIGTTTPDAELTILGNPQTVVYPVTGNSTTLGTDLHISGADGANTRITQDAYGTGSYVAFTGRVARGTAASPTQIQSGDTLAQFTARGFSNGTLQFGNVSTGRVDIVAAEAFTDTSRATNVAIYTTATGAIAATAVATFSSAAGLSVTGNVTGGNIKTAGQVSATGNALFLASTAVPVGGTAGAGIMMSSTANLGVFFGSGAPTIAAAQGSLYLNTAGSSTSTRLYVNTTGSTSWTAVTTVI